MQGEPGNLARSAEERVSHLAPLLPRRRSGEEMGVGASVSGERENFLAFPVFRPVIRLPHLFSSLLLGEVGCSLNVTSN